ncbi:TonB-dependent receptor [Xenorhabdus bovienii]|uniref:TonB-dependent receptor n=1 Tax=Xenorhabdus bovienii TaxID=40576 RepID=UPI003DA57748
MMIFNRDAVTLAALISIPFNSFAETNEKDQKIELDTITVTAQKIKTEQQKTPVSMSVLTDFDLERQNIENISEAIMRIPNFYMVKAGNPSDAGFFSMRGITPGMEGEQSVGFFIDGVNTNTYDSELLDIDKIEVLRGPQATLYGRNTEAGVVNVITKDPDFSPEYNFGLSYGTYNRTQANAILGGSINQSEDWAYRAALKYLYSDGYFKRDYDGKKNVDNNRDFSGRLKLRWQPSDYNWDVITTFDMQNRRNGNMSFAALDDIKKGRKYVNSNYIGKVNVDSYKGQVKAVYSWDDLDFTSISAYTDEKKIDNQDLDFTKNSISELLMKRKTNYLSQEFRLNSKNEGAFNWLIGAYTFHQKDKNIIDYRNIPNKFSMLRGSDIKTDNYALFGNASYYLLDNVELVAGLRYDYEKKNIDFKLSGMGESQDNNRLSFDTWLPKVGVNYYMTDNVMSYASVSRGYKSGGFNTLGPKSSRSYGAEYTTNYETGFKSEWFDKRVRWNTSFFWIDLKDQQVEVASYPLSYTVNSGKSVSRGIESELAWRITRSLTASVNAGYTHANFKDFPTEIKTTEGKFAAVNYKNNRPANSPDYTYGVGVDYNFLNGYFVRADYNVKGKTYFDNSNSKKQSAYGLLDLGAGYETNDYAVKLWVKNALNQKYATRAFQMDDGKWYARAGEGMNFGVNVNIKFQ